MGIYRDLDLPWPPDRLSTGDIRDLVPLDESPMQPKPPMGFFTALTSTAGYAPRGETVLIPLEVESACAPETPCGWCADCLLGSNWN